MPDDAVQVKAETASSHIRRWTDSLHVTFGAFLSPLVWLDGPMRIPAVPSLCGFTRSSATTPPHPHKSFTSFSSLRVLLLFGSGIIYFLLTAASLGCILTAPPRCWSRHKFFHTLGERLRSLWKQGLLGQRLLTQAGGLFCFYETRFRYRGNLFWQSCDSCCRTFAH